MLKNNFFDRDAVRVAKALLGKVMPELPYRFVDRSYAHCCTSNPIKRTRRKNHS